MKKALEKSKSTESRTESTGCPTSDAAEKNAIPFGYSSPRWTGEIADCSMPMTFDQHSNCGFGCLYCFAAFQRGINLCAKDYLANKVRSVNPETVMRIFTDLDNPRNQFAPYIKAGMTVQWGGMSDPFCKYERQSGVGLKLMRFFRERGQQISFSTKGTWWLKDSRYTELFKDNPDWHVKISIITLDERKARAVERGVPHPEQRIEAIAKLAELNGNVTLRLRPFIIGISNPSYPELIKKAGAAGAISVSSEFFCFENRSPTLRQHLPLLNDLCGFDVRGYYRKYSTGAGYLRLNRRIKEPFVRGMLDACNAANIPLFISDPHFKEVSAGSSCCGLPDRMAFSRGHFTQALLLARENGQVRWDEIAKDMNHLAGLDWGRAHGFNVGTMERKAKFHDKSMVEYLRWLWNNPNAGLAPYKYFDGAMKPVGKDENGNLIYEYDSSRGADFKSTRCSKGCKCADLSEDARP